MIEWFLKCNWMGQLIIMAYAALLFKLLGYLPLHSERSFWNKKKTLRYEIEVGFRNLERHPGGIFAPIIIFDLSGDDKKEILFGLMLFNFVLAFEVQKYGSRNS